MTVDRLAWIRIFGSVAREANNLDDAARRSDRYYGRSEGQLAAFDDGPNTPTPTGHRLTAWEAYQAFGAEVLEEAVEYGAAILRHSPTSTADALKRRRESLRVSPANIGRAARVSEAQVKAAESRPGTVRLIDLNRIALVLGLDERRLAFDPAETGDNPLAVRLRKLAYRENESANRISPTAALLFAEAASIVRIQHRLQKWLEIDGESKKFAPYDDYGGPGLPAYKVGYQLAENARKRLDLGERPIPSMRELVEDRLGIPVVQAALPPAIAGATIATEADDGGEARGIVLNTTGDNENVWVRRVTAAHELGHLLFDHDAKLETLRVDPYSKNGTDPEDGDKDPVEQRANAFAAAFLAPLEAVREFAPSVSADAIAKTMHEFRISLTTACYHIRNAHFRNCEIPSIAHLHEEPSDEQKAAENFTTDYFPSAFRGTSEQRRGRFAYLVAKCRKEGLLSEDTAALYLQCDPADLDDNLDLVIELCGPSG